MNYSKILFTLTLSGFLFVSCKEKPQETVVLSAKATTVQKVKKEIVAANLQTASFTIEGMTCAMGCAKTIEQELSGLDGVQKATVDFEKKLGTVTFDKTMQTPEKLSKVVEATADGKTYTVSSTKL
ncbi:heavy metal-associated domain-containing protein [Flavobacterium sp.]|uniref:heavy-metal-associated domain-containing protein n=1 Tax=Flavobacterium sp. TaxID=239 RepID=UPI00286B9015|nr:heavy metal-associated domain-containing protein [Flavobacterium sp.]